MLLLNLRRELDDARRRGLRFADVWTPAVERAAAGAVEWLEALWATEHAWRRAYYRVPPLRREQACSLLLEDAELVDGSAADRTCERCGTEIPAGRHRNARYCDDACRRLANYHNERAARAH